MLLSLISSFKSLNDRVIVVQLLLIYTMIGIFGILISNIIITTREKTQKKNARPTMNETMTSLEIHTCMLVHKQP